MSLPVAVEAVLGAVEGARPIVALRESTIVYPLVNAAHVVGVALLFGSIVPLDLRLAGWQAGVVPVDRAARLLLPVTVAGLALAMIAGLLLFATDARGYAGSTLFQIKMLLLALAIINALALRRVAWRGDVAPALRLRVAGLVSALAWLGVIVLGRLVGYF